MSSSKKTILIVDDDEILRSGMQQILSSAGNHVAEVSNAKEAVEVLKEKKFDLVVSNFGMPGMDGLQLFEYVKCHQRSRFLLLAEHSSTLQSSQAQQLGIDGFLNKPFKREDFLKLAQDLLDRGESRNKVLNDLDYIQVPVTDFIAGSILQMDLYVCISEKYIKIANRGDMLAQDRVQVYFQRGLSWLYMKKKDFAKSVGFDLGLTQSALPEARIECARKIRLTMQVTDDLISQLRRSGLDRQQLEETSSVIMNAVEMLASSEDTFKLLESMEIAGTLPPHLIAVAIWSCLIAKKFGWESQSTLFKIAICALFHDVGKKEIDDPLLHKSRNNLSRHEAKAVEGHTLRGRDILQSVPGMLEDAVMVALQHHELYRGGGYPYGLKFQQIHPLARLISLANHLCELLRDGDSDPGIQGAYAHLNLNARDFDPDFFKALTALVRSCSESKSKATQTG